MREIRINTLGEITGGEDQGSFVEVIDDSETSGGFLILIYESADRSSGHDSWVETIVDVEAYFEEAGWEIAWQT